MTKEREWNSVKLPSDKELAELVRDDECRRFIFGGRNFAAFAQVHFRIMRLVLILGLIVGFWTMCFTFYTLFVRAPAGWPLGAIGPESPFVAKLFYAIFPIIWNLMALQMIRQVSRKLKEAKRAE